MEAPHFAAMASEFIGRFYFYQNQAYSNITSRVMLKAAVALL
jgi:hypothetical protein